MGKAALLALFLVAVILAVWNDADDTLDRAKQEHQHCIEAAFSPEAVSQCESDWREAQDAYYIP